MPGETKIHFLNTAQSDCILLESEGHFALVDAAEDNDYPSEKPHLKRRGYEQEVVDYLLAHARGTDGFVTLDFVMGTHAHSDHLGGFDTVILHPEIRVKRAYLRRYDEQRVFVFERKRWDNNEVYTQMRDALHKVGAPITEDFNGAKTQLGAFQITFLYNENEPRFPKYGENVNSVVLLAETGKTRVLLAGDMNYKTGDERRIANRVGKIDLLKVGHHGLVGSSSVYFLKKLSPRYAVVPNSKRKMYPDVKWKLRHVAHAEVHTTVDENGVVAILGDNAEIKIQSGAMPPGTPNSRR